MALSLISDFTGADENPLSEGGNWANLTSGATAGIQRVGGAVTGPSGAVGASYWTPANFGPDLEAYITIATFSVGVTVAIYARVQQEGGANTADGYLIGTFLGATGSTIARIDNFLTTVLNSTTAVTWASGDTLGCRLRGSTLQLWRKPSGSSNWNVVISAVDTTYASAGKIGLQIRLNTSSEDDFFAGAAEFAFGADVQATPASVPPVRFGPF